MKRLNTLLLLFAILLLPNWAWADSFLELYFHAINRRGCPEG